MWALYALSSGVFNAFWTSQIKSKVRDQGALPFTAGVRWGVVLLLAPFAVWQWGHVSGLWWLLTGLAGLLESLNVWTLSRGARRDYYSTYALSNTTPFFTILLAVPFLHEEVNATLATGVLLVVAGVLWLYYRGHWSWWGLAAAVVGAVGNLFSKMVIAQAGPLQHAFVCFTVGAAGTTLVSVGTGSRKTLAQVGRNIWTNRLLSFLSFFGTVTFYVALSQAPVSRVSPLFRVNMAVGFLLSVLHLKEKEDWKGRGLGAALLLAGIILVLWK